jgi:hypothetical protein
MSSITPRSAFQNAASSTLLKPKFEPTQHQPPRLDEFGFNLKAKGRLDGNNILKDNSRNKIP